MVEQMMALQPVRAEIDSDAVTSPIGTAMAARADTNR